MDITVVAVRGRRVVVAVVVVAAEALRSKLIDIGE